MTRLPTGSRVSRALACPTSMVLAPTPMDTATDAGNPYAGEGNERHDAAEVAIHFGDEASLDERLAAMLVGCDERLTEVVVSYDPATGVGEIHRDLGKRAYPAEPDGKIWATADLIGIGPAKLVVVDHKLHADRGDPAEDAQILTIALAAARALGRDGAEVAINYLGRGYFDGPHAVDAFALDVHAAALAELVERVEAAAAAPTEHLAVGDHCRHCDVFGACPKQVALVTRAQAPDLADAIEARIPFGTDDEGAREAYLMLKRLKVLVARLSDALRARAAERPIPLGGGIEYGPRTTRGQERLDGSVVYQVLAAKYGAEDAASVVEMTATKSAVAKYARELAKANGQKAAPTERALLKLIRDAGGASREQTTKIDEHPVALPAAGETTGEE